MSEHIVSIRIYLLIFTVLLVLTGVTIYAAFLDLGVMNTVVALAIAGVKATLVVLYFMHLRYGSYLTKLFWVAGLLWLAILLVLTMNDYLTRGWSFQPKGWTGLTPVPATDGHFVAPPLRRDSPLGGSTALGPRQLVASDAAGLAPDFWLPSDSCPLGTERRNDGGERQN